MLEITTVDHPSTHETTVTLRLDVACYQRVTMEALNHEGGIGPTTSRLRREVARAVIGGDLADEWRDATRELTRDLEMSRLALRTMTDDRNRLARVVDKLTGA